MAGKELKLKDRIILVSVILFLMLPVFAQFEPAPVEKSTEKVVNQGKVFYLHTVKKGHTLYSICKVYNVTEADISLANPGVSLNVLSEGQVLKIPLETSVSSVTKAELKDNDQDFYYHTLQPKQTLFYLHQKYNVPLEAIYKYNPGADLGVQVGQVIKIPKNYKATDTYIAPPPEIMGTKYTVKPGDTLNIIANSFGIPEADIINANKELRWGMKPGQTIIIPNKPSQGLMDYSADSESVGLTYFLPQFGDKECDSLANSRLKEPVKIAVMLPFHTVDMYEVDTSQFNDTIDEGIVKPNTFRGRGAAEFYEGLLLAVDTLKQQGINMQLYAYDTEGDTNKIKRILKDLDKVQPSLIIGPFLNDDVRIVSQYSIENGIPFVPPLINEDETIRNNSFLFQVTPSLQSEITASVNYLAQYYNQNIILAYKPGFTEQTNIDLFKKLLREKSELKLQTDTFCFQEVIIDDNFTHKMSHYLKKEKKNVFILLTTNEPYVSNILSQLFFSSKYQDIEVFGLPQWQKYSNVSIEHMHGLQVTLFAPYFIDYSREDTRNFIIKCRNILGYEPFKTSLKGTGMNYTFLGYDLGVYFIKAVNRYGKYVTQCTNSYKPDILLVSDYHFEKVKPIGCIENTSVNIIRYTKDFRLEKVK